MPQIFIEHLLIARQKLEFRGSRKMDKRHESFPPGKVSAYVEG